MSRQVKVKIRLRQTNAAGPYINIVFENVAKNLKRQRKDKIVEGCETVSNSKKKLILTTDPFDLSFARFEKLNPNESEELLKKAHELCIKLIKDAWSSGYRQIVLCNKKIVFKSSNEEAITGDVIKRLAKKYNKACYVFSAPDVVEESGRRT